MMVGIVIRVLVRGEDVPQWRQPNAREHEPGSSHLFSSRPPSMTDNRGFVCM